MRLLIDIWEGIKIAFQALRANKMRSILTTLGIVIGITTVIGIHSIIQGLNAAFYNSISSLGSDILYVGKFSWMSRTDWIEARNRKDITLEREVKALQEQATLVKAIAPTVAARRTVKYGSEKLSDVTIQGTTEAYSVTANVIPEVGRMLTAQDVEHRRNVCVIGWEVADKLFKNVNPLGRRILIGTDSFHVIGVLEKRGSLLGHNLDTEVIIPIGVFYKLYGSRRWLTIQVKVADPNLIEEAKDEITGILRRVRKVAPHEENDFAINQQDMIADMYHRLTGALYAVAFGVGSIALLVGGIGIMNILLVSVTERTKEIGIRKAVGAKNRDIMWQFLIESLAVSFLGGFIGIVLGFGLAKLVAATTFLSASVSPISVIIGVVFIFVTGIVFGLFPAYKAAKLDPIQSLRYE
ncbi:MAG: ABC transporter permease [candidate division KSB1 bacterium]|nr:ABC transporter permease [candidate division KSB1 bacterium]MDZ7319160.1 ABC transporter permease [candidate division KSB1 bacterium]MDZ7342761.1 ABC transporter permease [candidate division KSB1 bacterium]